MFPTELLATIIAAVATLMSGWLVSRKTAEQAEHRDKDRKQIEELARTVEAEAEVRRAEAVKAVAAHAPDASPEELAQLITAAFSKATSLPGGTDTNPTWSLVQDLVNGYHRQALAQARAQFWFSIIAASIGFIVIISALLSGSSSDRTGIEILYNSFPGIVIDAVAALFFRQAGETRERATALYDRLRTDDQRGRALALVNSIDDANVRNAVKAEVALHMAGLEKSPVGELLPKLLRIDFPPAETGSVS